MDQKVDFLPRKLKKVDFLVKKVEFLGQKMDTCIRKWVWGKKYRIDHDTMTFGHEFYGKPKNDSFITIYTDGSVIRSPTDMFDTQAGGGLYICGGNSINQASMEELILWRKQLGYDVNTVSTSELNYDRDSIKNYIQNAYQDWPNPPEYVVLVGDTDGSYQIPFFSSTGGSSDYDYSLLEGDDLLPEIIIGRISALNVTTTTSSLFQIMT